MYYVLKNDTFSFELLPMHHLLEELASCLIARKKSYWFEGRRV